VVGGINGDEIIQSINLAKSSFSTKEMNTIPSDYNDRNVSIKVVKIIQSYTKIINKVIWFKK